MHRYLCSGLSVLLGLCLLFFSPSVRADSLIIPGTGDSQALLSSLAEAYNKQTSADVQIPASVGSSGGIQQVLHDKAVLARVARPLTKKEIKAGLKWQQFAYAPVVFACHPEEPDIINLTSEQVNGIFTGRYQDWSQLGGDAGKIYVAQREMGDSSRTILGQHFPFFTGSTALVGKTLYSTPEMVEALSRYPNTIGYLPVPAISGSDVRPLQLDGVAPTEDTLQSGDYPLSLPLAVVWKGALDAPAADFVNFLSTSKARALMRDFGVVPVKGN